MKIVFFGSDDFALVHLEKLFDSSHEVVACVTQPDRPKGRGMKMVLSSIKEFALANNLLCLQPDDINDADFTEQLKGLHADVFTVIAYGRILPQKILDIPTKMPINIHGSLLPKYRGAAPINWAIINGETSTGLTAIEMNTKMDAGDILGQTETSIDITDTSQSLREKMMHQGADLLIDVLNQVSNGTHTVQKQNESDVTIAKKLTKELGSIDWNKTTVEIYNLIRGLVPWPSAYTQYKGRQLKVFNSKIIEDSDLDKKPGTVVDVGKEGIDIKTGNGVLRLKEVQLQSSKQMDAHAFVVGHQIKAGVLMGTEPY